MRHDIILTLGLRRNLTIQIYKFKEGENMSKGNVILGTAFDDWDEIENWEDVEEVLLEYAQKLGITIEVNYSEEGALMVPRYAKKKLFINIFAAPRLGLFSGWFSGRDVHRVFDQYIGEEFLQASPVGIKITDEKDFAAAEIIGASLFILFNPLLSDDSATVIRRIMEEYVAFIPQDSAEREKIAKENMANIRESSWENFVEIFRISGGKKILERNIKQVRERYDDLLSKAKKGNILVFPGEIRIRSGRLDRDSAEDIGDYIIIIETFPGSKNDDIHLVSITPDAEEHPAVWDGGYCPGTIDDGINTLLDKKEFALLTETMIEFLRVG